MIELGQRVHDGQAEQRVYALVGPGETPSVHLLPDSPKSLALLNASSTPLHFWRLNVTTGATAPTELTPRCGRTGEHCVKAPPES